MARVVSYGVPFAAPPPLAAPLGSSPALFPFPFLNLLPSLLPHYFFSICLFPFFVSLAFFIFPQFLPLPLCLFIPFHLFPPASPTSPFPSLSFAIEMLQWGSGDILLRAKKQGSLTTSISTFTHIYSLPLFQWYTSILDSTLVMRSEN